MFRYSVSFKMADGTITGVGLDAPSAARAWALAAKLVIGVIASRHGRALRMYAVHA